MNDIRGLFFRDFNNAYFPEILKEIYRDRIYYPYIERPNRKDLTVLDIGGNCGLFTHYVEPYASKIFIVEPSKQHCETINQMIKFNKIDHKVTVIQKALANENGTTSFYHNKNSTMFSLLPDVDDKSQEPETVETTRLDTLFTQYNIKHVDFMKLDIEGAEAQVIGGDGFEQVADKIDSMVFEWHTWSKMNPNLMVTALKDYGFKVERIPSDAVLFGATRI